MVATLTTTRFWYDAGGQVRFRNVNIRTIE